MEFKGTKGEFNGGWKAHELPEKVGYATHEIHWSKDGECVAEVVHGEANAKLIAAAPELLEALMGLLRITDDSHGVSGYHLNDKTALWNEFPELELAEKAINKALK